jgi:Spy/CpxP family protein refolding chaperone
LQNENAKKHLNLTEDQTAKLQKIFDDQRANFPRPARGGANGAQASDEDRKKYADQIEKYQSDVNKLVAEALTEEQRAKYKVLPFQIAGGLETRFFNARLFDALDLSEEQKTKFKQLEEETSAEFRKLFTPSDGPRPTADEAQKQRDEFQKKSDELRKSIREKAVALLTPEQKAKAEKLTEESKQLKLQPQRNERGRGDRQRGDRERGDRDRGDRRGGNEYRPNDDSWRPGAGTPENGGNSRRPFPRRDSSTTPSPEI